MKTLLQIALDQAESNGATYADARFSSYRREFMVARGPILVEMSDNREEGIAVRVFADGAWGFAAAQVKTSDESAELALRALQIARMNARISRNKLNLVPIQPFISQWKSPCSKDPFEVPLQEKTALLLDINSRLKSHNGIADAYSMMHFWQAAKLFMSTAGSCIDQKMTWSDAEYWAVAVGDQRAVRRQYQAMPRQMGYELIESMPLIAETGRVAREAIETLHARPVDMDRTDLILLPSHTRLVIHETIGHATELDRVLGWEADYAGTSFATPEKLNRYQYGSPIFNVTADRTQPGGMASCAFDDDGIPTRRWPIINKGILSGYATTRDTADFIGSDTSNACSFADSWNSMPILRMANVCIDAGPADAPSLSELIADTKDGILIDGMGSFSIDHQRINFQFGSDYSRRIRNGRLEEVLYNVTYEGSNPDFWNSVDTICNPSEWLPYGLNGCAKGQPVQTAALTHGSAPLRLHNIQLRRNGL